MGFPRVPVPYGEVPGCQFDVSVHVLCSDLGVGSVEGPVLTYTDDCDAVDVARGHVVRSSVIRKINRDRKVSIHCDQRCETVQNKSRFIFRRVSKCSIKQWWQRFIMYFRGGETPIAALQMRGETMRP